MVNFARDNFLGTYDEFRARYEKPIMEGDVLRSRELIENLTQVVLRRGKALLKMQLPPKKEWILYCKLSPIQHRLYCAFLESYGEPTDGKATADLLTAYAALLQVMNHPDIIHLKLCPEGQQDQDEDMEAVMPPEESSAGWSWESEERLAEKRQIAVAQSKKRRQKISDRQKSYEWARSVIFASGAPASYDTGVLENSGKMAVLMQIIEESFACGDKVVVFSQSVPTLKIISAFLHASAFNPSQAQRADNPLARKTAPSAPINKRRKTAVRPKRDPAGILRKRKTVKGQKPSSVAKDVNTDDWFLQIDGTTTGAKRMEYIQVCLSLSLLSRLDYDCCLANHTCARFLFTGF